MDFYLKARHLMREYRISPKKRLGQNFMIDEYFLQRMISHAAIEPSDIVLEIGAGFGFLTRQLAPKAKKVIAIEADARLIGVLQRELSDFGNIEIVEGDILKVTLPRFNKVVSNPPFSISSPLLFHLFNKSFECAILTFQCEFGNRLKAPVNSKDYSRLTVSTYYRAEVKLLELVPKESFYPIPKVDSIIVELKPRHLPPFWLRDEDFFNEVVRTLFTQRNKKVRNAILPLLLKCRLEESKVMRQIECLSLQNKRVRELTPEDFGTLANELST